MFKYSLRSYIFVLFLSAFLFLSLSLIGSQYYFSSKVAVDSTHKIFNLISKNIMNELTLDNNTIRDLLRGNINNKDLNEQIKLHYEHPALDDLIRMIRVNKRIYAMHFTHKDGAYYEVVNMHESPLLARLYNAPKETRWTVIINIANQTLYSFLNNEDKLISEYITPRRYNPKSRPWYSKAIQSNSEINTLPYKFRHIRDTGVTYAIKLQKEGTVFAIDYTMRKINTLLVQQKFNQKSEVFVFNQKSEIIASSNSESLEIDKALNKAFLKNNKNSIVEYKIDDTNYFTIFKPLKNKNLFLGIKIDADNLLKPYHENLQYLLLISIIVTFFTILILIFLTKKILKPIKALIHQNEKIKNREFSRVHEINTNIKELSELSLSFVVMSHSISEYQIAQQNLLDSIVKLIAQAVDAKSPYTGGHCERVPKIAQMLIEKADASKEGIFEDFSLNSEEELREFELGAWLHDCGKVTTPEYVVDKSTKLECVNDRIHEIRTRFEVLWRDTQIKYLTSKLNKEDETKITTRLHSEQTKLLDDFKFIANANIGGEFMSSEQQNRIKKISEIEWERNFDDTLGVGQVEILRYDNKKVNSFPIKEKLLSDKKQHIIKRENFNYEDYKRDGFKEEVPLHLYNHGEVYNLCITKGTLNKEERYKINEHVIQTIKMLEQIPFPSHMKRVPEYAGTHHETLLGTGYPRKLTKKELSIPSRIMAFADVFEALSASDRPYKKAKKLSESIKILSIMVKEEHFDKEILKLFLENDLHNLYAKKYLKEEQIDNVNIEDYI